MEQPDEFAPGALIGGKFSVVRTLGRGGMGVVYEAEHALSGRRVAVKLLLASLALHPQSIQRFLREGRAAASIGDPHIVEVLDMGQLPGGDLYVALEYLDGQELSRAMAHERQMRIPRVAHIMAQLAGAMGKAHARGIVHRDLKPANVFLVERDGDPDYVKILDFGIAKLENPGAEKPGEPVTRTGQIIGTPLYMSSEQLRGSRDVDARTDVYAMGVMLFEMLCGTVPFRAETMPEMFLQIMTQTPPTLESFRANLPRELVQIVERAMARDAAVRFATGTELAAALRPWAKDWDPKARLSESLDSTIQANVALPAVTPPPTTSAAMSFDLSRPAAPQPRKRAVIAAALATLGLGVVGTGLYLSQRSGAAPAASTRAVASTSTPSAPPPQAPLAEPSRQAPHQSEPAVAPVAERVTIRFAGEAGTEVTIAGYPPCTTPCALELPRTTTPTSVAFRAPDGNRWTYETTADASREVAVVSPPRARSGSNAQSGRRATRATHEAAQPPAAPHTSSPAEPHIEMNQ